MIEEWGQTEKKTQLEAWRMVILAREGAREREREDACMDGLVQAVFTSFCRPLLSWLFQKVNLLLRPVSRSLVWSLCFFSFLLSISHTKWVCLVDIVREEKQQCYYHWLLRMNVKHKLSQVKSRQVKNEQEQNQLRQRKTLLTSTNSSLASFNNKTFTSSSLPFPFSELTTREGGKCSQWHSKRERERIESLSEGMFLLLCHKAKVPLNFQLFYSATEFVMLPHYTVYPLSGWQSFSLSSSPPSPSLFPFSPSHLAIHKMGERRKMCVCTRKD